MEPNDEHIRKLTGNSKPEENFKVPQGYFEAFSSTVKEKIESRSQPKKAPFYSVFLRPVFSIPVAAIIVIVAGYFVFFSSPTPEQPVLVTAEMQDTLDISEEAIEEYLANDIELVGVDETLDEDILVYVLEADDDKVSVETVDSKGRSGVIKDSAAELDAEDIEEYLLEHADETLFENL
ncbi:MAG: hypothetical protein F9K23_16170 [Bacteroidetes bacterium]|nr:MAG: hypothetical protein F9K23_16170 [Bacteroidota bacterium]